MLLPTDCELDLDEYRKLVLRDCPDLWLQPTALRCGEHHTEFLNQLRVVELSPLCPNLSHWHRVAIYYYFDRKHPQELVARIALLNTRARFGEKCLDFPLAKAEQYLHNFRKDEPDFMNHFFQILGLSEKKLIFISRLNAPCSGRVITKPS